MKKRLFFLSCSLIFHLIILYQWSGSSIFLGKGQKKARLNNHSYAVKVVSNAKKIMLKKKHFIIKKKINEKRPEKRVKNNRYEKKRRGKGRFFNRAIVYPEIARMRGWEGVVELKLSLNPQGKVVEVEMINSSGFKVLDEVAILTAKTWRFSLDNGRVIKKEIHFNLPRQ